MWFPESFQQVHGNGALERAWSWKHFPSEKHFQFPHRAKCNNSPDIIITKGKKSFMQTCCCNLGIYKLHPLHNLKAMWFKMEPTQKRGLLVKAIRQFLPSLSESDRDSYFLSYLRHFLKIGLFLSICNIYPQRFNKIFLFFF